MAGVWRKPLAREAVEHGHTTSVVRYDAGSRFPEHAHPLGEEILVLEGIFSDEHGNYPTGTYLRSPPQSKHSPFSEEGCVLLVKLDQFDPTDDAFSPSGPGVPDETTCSLQRAWSDQGESDAGGATSCTDSDQNQAHTGRNQAQRHQPAA